MADRELRREIPLDATPEQVWDAIATGPGISAWFVPHRVEPGVGGTVGQDFGGGFEMVGRVTAWEPGHRFGYGAATPPEQGPDYAFEFLVEGRDGGGAVLRFVQSGFLDGPGQDDEYDSFDAGWTLFFQNLASYLAHFAPRPATTIVTMAWVEGGAAQLRPVLHAALGLTGPPPLGAAVTLRPDGIAAVSGVVDVASDEFLGVRSASGLHRFGTEGEQGCGISAYHYLFDGPVDAAALTAAWQSWLTGLAPAPPTS